MTANVLEHRRAKAFAEALEAHRTGQPASSPVMGQLLDTAEVLTTLTVPALDLEVRSVQRAQLLAAFEQTMAGGGLTTVPQQRRHRAERVGPRRRWGRRFAIGGLVAGVTVGSFAGVAAASSDALPGDALYGMKRGLEGLRLDLARSDSERGALLLDDATTRLDEARGLVGRAGGAQALSADTVARLGAALGDMHAEAAKGRELLRSVYRANGSLDPMRKLAAFTEGQDDRWADLQDHLPAQLTPVAGQVNQLFGDMDEDVAPLHLDPQQGLSDSPRPAGQTGGQAPADSGSAPGTGSGPSSDASAGAKPGGGQPSAGGPAQGAGSAPGASQAPGAVGGPVGGLVNGLTGSLTGGGSPAPSGAPASTPIAKSGSSAAPSTAPNTVPGLDLPPLIPGLLPGLGLTGN